MPLRTVCIVDSKRSLRDFAERVRDARSRMRLTQAQFAERMAVTPLTVHRWETGQSRPQSLALDRLREVEEAMGARGRRLRARLQLPTRRRRPCPWTSPGTPPPSCWWRKRTAWPTGTSSNAAFASETARIDPLPAPTDRGLRADVAAGAVALPARRRRRRRQDHHDGTLRAGDAVPPARSPRADHPAGRARRQLGTRAAYLVPAPIPHRIRGGVPERFEPFRGSGWRSGDRLPRHHGHRAGVRGALRPECRALRSGGVR